jgi:MFS family permease
MESPLLLSQRSWRTHYPFLFLFYFNVFCSCASYALVLPAIWMFLEDSGDQDNIVAYILAAFSVGEVLGAIVFGCLRDVFSTKKTLLITLFLGLLGSVFGILSLFNTLYMSDPHFKMLAILISRLLQGIWNGGEQAVEQSYISEIVSDISKIKALSEIGIAGIGGYILGPIIGVIVSLIDIDIYEDLKIEGYYAPGILQLIILIIMIVVNFIKFKEIPVEKRVNRMEEYETYVVPNKSGIFVCLAICFLLFNGFTVQETITGPLVTDEKQVIYI